MLTRTLALAVATGAALVVLVPGAPGRPSADQAFPVTVTAGGETVTIAKRPQRIVSLSATATESLFAIGAGSQVIAVDDQSDYPKQAPKSSLSGFTPNVEAIAGYRPDLVVIAYDPKDLAASLRRLGITVLRHNAPQTLPGAYQQIRQLGLVTGHADEATTVIGRMKRRIAAIVADGKRRAAGLSVFHELSPDLYSASSRTFVGRVYAAFGLRNVADEADRTGSGYPQVSAEYLIATNPDVIVLADSVCCGQKPSTVAARPGWERVSAVRTGSIVRLDDSIASRWGPRLVDFFRAVSAALTRLRPA